MSKKGKHLELSSRPFVLNFLDIETAPKIAYVWGLFKQNIGINQIVEPGRTICFASQRFEPAAEKWSNVHFRSEYHHAHEDMVRAAWKVLDESDGIVTYNGNSFDIPTLNTEFLKLGLAPPSPYKSIDLYQVMRSTFRADSNKLDYVLKMLGLGQKMPNKGMELWTECMDASRLKDQGLKVPKHLRQAWATMKAYNIQDVEVMPEFYRKLLPWIKRHPNLDMWSTEDVPVCTKCGSTHIQRRGLERLSTMVYHRFQCMSCYSWMRETVGGVRRSNKRAIS